MKTFLMTTLAAISLLGATAAQAQESTVTVNEPPTRERVETRTAYGVPLTVAGGGLLVASYVPSMIVAAESPNDSDKMLWAPVVGPWLDLADRGGCPVGRSCDTENGYKALLIADGIVQDVGTVMLISGLISAGVESSRPTTAKHEPQKPSFKLTTMQFGRGASMGAGIVGTF